MNALPSMADIPSHLLVSCIQKMESQSFARAYRTCSQVLWQIEGNKRRISISLPHSVSIDTIPEGIAVRVIKDKAVLWSEVCPPGEFVENGICKLAFFRFDSISFNIDSLFGELWLNRLLAAFQKYRIIFSHCSTSYGPHIPAIIKSLRIKDLEVRGIIPNVASALDLDGLPTIDKLTVSRTSGNVAENLLRNVAPRSRHVNLKFLGNIQIYARLIVNCLKKIQKGTDKRSGKLSVTQTAGVNDVLTPATLAEMLDCPSLETTEDFEANGYSLLALPFADGGRLLLVFKKYYSPLKRLRGINFWYATTTDADDLKRLFPDIYTSSQQRSVMTKTMEMVRNKHSI